MARVYINGDKSRHKGLVTTVLYICSEILHTLRAYDYSGTVDLHLRHAGPEWLVGAENPIVYLTPFGFCGTASLGHALNTPSSHHKTSLLDEHDHAMTLFST
jgi:hypothetical protein